MINIKKNTLAESNPGIIAGLGCVKRLEFSSRSTKNKGTANERLKLLALVASAIKEIERRPTARLKACSYNDSLVILECPSRLQQRLVIIGTSTTVINEFFC